MRILYHHRTQAGDAQGVHIQEIVRAFRELGHEVRIAAIRGEEEARRASRAPQGSGLLQSVPAWLYEVLSLGYNLYGYRMLRREAAAFGPDMIYERYSLNTYCGIWAARRLRIPIVLEVNAPLATEQERLGRLSFRRLARFSERWICSRSTRTIVVTGVMRDLLAAEGVPRDHMAVVTNGIDPKRFHPGISGDAVRARNGLDGKVVIGFVGWFRKWHGLEMLLEVFHRSGLSGRGARLMLVGDGPARPDLDRYVRANALEAAVVFTGPVPHDEIPAYIAAMDVAVQPSAPEYACPMKIVEYMAMGKCVVAPDQPNIREIVQAGRSGLLFPPGKAEDLGAALAAAGDDAGLRERLGGEAVATVRSRGFLWEANARRALALAAGEGA